MLASDYDIGEFLHLLVERCQSILSLTTSGVLVVGPKAISTWLRQRLTRCCGWNEPRSTSGTAPASRHDVIDGALNEV